MLLFLIPGRTWFWLRSIGVERSSETLRRVIVRYLQQNPNDLEGFPLELSVGQSWSDYLDQMIQDGTRADHITLQTAPNLYNVQFIVYSSLGVEATTIIYPIIGVAVATFHLRHFAEGEGEHYVCFEEHDKVIESTAGQEGEGR